MAQKPAINIISNKQKRMGKIWSVDTTVFRGTRMPGQEHSNYVLSVYARQSQQVKTQEVVETKGNEITAAPRVLKQVN